MQRGQLCGHGWLSMHRHCCLVCRHTHRQTENCAFHHVAILSIAAKLLMVVSRERSRVDGCGLPCKDSKTFHVVISKGSQPGQRHVMEGEGDETADTAAGDLVFVLQQKPHAKLRRSGGPLELLQMPTQLYDCVRPTNSDSDHDIQ
jgi:hypothetical protein